MITLEELSFIAEIIAAIAVVASLIYVGLGVRQNARAVRLNRAWLNPISMVEIN